MNSFKNVLKEKLTDIKAQFNEFDPSYEFHKDSDTHFILVQPTYLNSNQEFEALCGNLLLDLMDSHPDESLAFVTNESLVQLHNPQSIFDAELPDSISFNEDVVFVSASSGDLFHEIFRSGDISYNKSTPSNFDFLKPLNASEIKVDDEMNLTMAA
jgi:hypothetical protein